MAKKRKKSKAETAAERKTREQLSWNSVMSRVNIGDIISVSVHRTTDFGVLVELGEGVIGLVHLSELPPDLTPKHFIGRIGEQIEVRVIKVESISHRVLLSLREVVVADAPPTEPQPALLIDKAPPSEAQPAFAIVWSPDVLSESEYARLVTAIGDLVRVHGAAGVSRIRGIQVDANIGAPTYSS